jgi:hypothetical protein
MENCSIYSHHIWYEEIVNVVANLTSEASIEVIGENDAWESITILGKKNPNKPQNKMTLTCKVREFPSFELGEPVDQITTILNGMRNYFGAITGVDQQLLKKLIYKISSINMEISVVVDNGFNAYFEEIVLTITEILEGFIFSNNNSIFDAPDSNNGIFDENADVILCHSGYSDVKDLEVLIEPQYLDQKIIENK